MEFTMTNEEYQRRIDDAKARAHGRWPEILLHLGLESRMIKKRVNMPCPFCGGRDRFQFTDKFGEGNYFCRSCGSGGGFQLAQQAKGMDFHAVLEAVEQYLGLYPKPVAYRSNEPSDEYMRKLVRQIWTESQPISRGDEVDRYLTSRGLALPEYPSVLRFHPRLAYYRKDEHGKSHKVAEYAAMVVRIDGSDGEIRAVNRTYLPNGRKLGTNDTKKVLGSGIAGLPVKLFEATDELVVTEGIEKGLALHLATHKPAWAMLGAGNFEQLVIPDTVTKLWIYGDNDANGDFTGQHFAFSLARRARREQKEGVRREVQVFIPKCPGTDWSDIWFRRWQALLAEARRAQPRQARRRDAEVRQVA